MGPEGLRRPSRSRDGRGRTRGQIDNSSYTKIAAGNKPLQSVYAHRAAKRYGLTMDYFFDGSFAKMDPSLREAIMTYLGGQKR